MTGDARLPWHDAVRFWWHSVRHMTHADAVYHDVRTDTVRCSACGRVWGSR